MFRNLRKRYKTTKVKYNVWWGKSGTLVGNFFSAGGASAPPVKQLRNALPYLSRHCFGDALSYMYILQLLVHVRWCTVIIVLILQPVYACTFDVYVDNFNKKLGIRLIIMLLSGIWLFEFSYTLRLGFVPEIHGNGRVGVYKNSSSNRTHSSSLTCPF